MARAFEHVLSTSMSKQVGLVWRSVKSVLNMKCKVSFNKKKSDLYNAKTDNPNEKRDCCRLFEQHQARDSGTNTVALMALKR